MEKEKREMTEEKDLKKKADEAVKEGKPFWYAPPAIKAENPDENQDKNHKG